MQPTPDHHLHTKAKQKNYSFRFEKNTTSHQSMISHPLAVAIHPAELHTTVVAELKCLHQSH